MAHNYLHIAKYKTGGPNSYLSLSQRVDFTIQTMAINHNINLKIDDDKVLSLDSQNNTNDKDLLSFIPSSSSGISSSNNSRSNSFSEVNKEVDYQERDSPSPSSIGSFISNYGSDSVSLDCVNSTNYQCGSNVKSELSKRCTQCMTIIKQAKEKQEVEANKHAEFLLEQLSLERKEEERKQVAQAKKRERKRQKRKAKQKGSNAELDDGDEKSEACDSHIKINIPMENEKQKINSPLPCRKETILTNSNIKENHSNEDPMSLTTSNSSNNNHNPPISKNKKKRSNKESSPINDISTKSKESLNVHNNTISNGHPVSVKFNSDSTDSISKANSKTNSNGNSSQPQATTNESTVEKKKEKARNKKSNKKTSRDVNHQKESDSLAAIPQSPPNDSTILDVSNDWSNGCINDDFLSELDYNTWCEIAGEAKRPIIDDQWKTVPKRKLAIVVLKKDIGKVIGQTGSTVKALRLHTGAHIDIEDIKEGVDATERTIHIRGQPESVAKAKDLIDDLIIGKITSKEIASLASPKRSAPTSTVAAPLLAGNMKSTPVTSKQLINAYSSQNKPLPIRKAPITSISNKQVSQYSNAFSESNVIRVGGPVPWVGTAVSKDDEKNFASVAAAGIVAPNSSGVCTSSSDSFKSSDSTFPTINEAVNYSPNTSDKINSIPNQNSYNSPVSVDAKHLAYGYIHGIRDDSFNDGSSESSSPLLLSNHMQISQTPQSAKSFARAPGSERHQRLTGTPDHSPHLQQNSSLPPQSMSPNGNFSGQNEWSMNFSRIDTSITPLTKVPLNVGHQSRFLSEHFQGNAPASNAAIYHNIDMLNGHKNPFTATINSNFQPNETFTDLPRVVPLLNPQARSFSPSIPLSIVNANVHQSNNYITPHELKELPRVSSELNPSAVTFEPQKPLFSVPKSDSNSNTLNHRHTPLNANNVSITDMVISSDVYGVGVYSNAFDVDLRDVIDLSSQDITSSASNSTVKPIGAERRTSNLPQIFSNVCGTDLLKSPNFNNMGVNLLPATSSHSQAPDESWRNYSKPWSQASSAQADWN